MSNQLDTKKNISGTEINKIQLSQKNSDELEEFVKRQINQKEQKDSTSEVYGNQDENLPNKAVLG